MRPYLAFAAAAAIVFPAGADTGRPQVGVDYARFAEHPSVRLAGPGHPWYFTGDARFACVQSDLEVNLTIAATGQEHGKLALGASLHDGGFSADGRYVAVAGMDRTVRVFEVATCKEVKSFSPFGVYS